MDEVLLERMADRVAVRSHPRSGTHLLAATIKKSFFPNVDLSTSGSGTGHWSNRYTTDPFPWAKLFRGGPHGIPDVVPPPRKVVYIFRDGRDVATSMYNATSLRNPKNLGMEFSLWLRSHLDWEYSPGNKASPAINIIQHWRRHVDAWRDLFIRNTNNVMLVKYCDLVGSRSRALVSSIARFLGFRQTLLCPDLGSWKYNQVENMVGVDPGEGKTGSYKEYFKEKDLELYDEIVGAHHWVDEWRALK